MFEALIYNRLKSFFASQNLLLENQFGFRSGRSTEQAALTLVDRVIPAMANKSYALCVLLDVSSCFDTVSHDLLFGKLQRCGVRGVALNLIESYFTDRTQQVVYQGG